MTRRQILLVFSFLLTGVIVYAATRDEWGRPLGPRYAGPEVQPRQVATPRFDLNPDERATIADLLASGRRELETGGVS